MGIIPTMDYTLILLWLLFTAGLPLSLRYYSCGRDRAGRRVMISVIVLTLLAGFFG